MMNKAHSHDHSENHDHEKHHPHSHVHGVVDPSLFDTERGLWAIRWSFLALILTAFFQLLIVFFTNSIALFADTVHNFADALTGLPLWLAFHLSKRPPTKRFTYGYGKVEDLVGIFIVFAIAVSAIVIAYQSVQRLFHPQPVSNLPILIAAGLIGFAGNEGVALFRIRIGRKIGSAALIADGYHARTDGFTSLAVLVGAAGVWAGYPIVDSLAGLFVSGLILLLTWQSSKLVFSRFLDGIDPEVIDEIREAVKNVSGVEELTEVRVRWIGHRLNAELNIAVDSSISIVKAHEIADIARHELLHRLSYLSNVVIHVDPVEASGEVHHKIQVHQHGELPPHSH